MRPADLLARLSARFAGEEVDLLGAFAPDATVSDGVRDDVTPEEADGELRRLSFPHVLHASHDETSVTLVFRAVDEGREANVFASWSFVLDSGQIRRVIVCSKSEAITLPVDPRLADFGFRRTARFGADAVADSAAVCRAADVVSASVGREARHDAREVLLNEDLVYIPYGWIGCVGFLVPRSTGSPILLGSGVPRHVHVWAYYRGFADGETSADRPNDLVVIEVREREATARALARVGEVPPDAALPHRFRGVDLYFSREALFRAELRGDFLFRVEPSTAGG